VSDLEPTPPPSDPTPVLSAEEPDRQAQPVDAEAPPRLPFPVVGIGASAGGLEAVSAFLGAMRPDSGMAFVLVQHLPPDRESLLAEILDRRTAMPVRQVEDGLAVEADHVYVIRPGHRLEIRDGRLHFGPPLGSPRAANRPVDDFFRSLAEEQRERAIAVVMSGMGSNGTAGAQAIKAVGGLCIAQDPDSAQFPSMPRHLIDAGYADFILRPEEIPEALLQYAGHPYAKGDREADAREALRREGHHLKEVLAVLRTRSRRDFGGYKAPTLLRRIQRRMGLAGIATLAEYARMLRQAPAEVTALADDLLIHVTGFFRDPEAWDALRERVIVPLVAGRDPGTPVRAWVTACSSGEEAYTLAMLLQEESDRAGKRLDIKVFATDLADRTLSQARAGVYPGGIESEISPERLERYFSREDAVYRVRPALRDRVVFAPQNLLEDPPFSRLDIATCRNLLIYLDPEVQRRVLSLLHFGLREGGSLFLGSNEAISGVEELFEPIDKKARIFRRVGPTRHGTIVFPLPHAVTGDLGLGRLRIAAAGADDPPRRDPQRPSPAQLTERALLEAHTPPAVSVDREGRILYYHGDTRPYLQQPSGEPTRELFALLREGLRGAVRVALQRAASGGAPAAAPEGWMDAEPGRRIGVAVLASPLYLGGPPEGPAATPDVYVLSFTDRGELATAPLADGGRGPDELRRLRAELQSTIEELQSSNAELKASHEEVMSINEELQSANEELETSKEEMQSLNEELTTVNTQLRAKMEEHLAASSDLASLLASTDIAVLFLDPGLCIRRYTPAVRELMDLIPGDVGRPLAALARRFDDPHLDDDARAVQDRLVPVEREVGGADGRHYQRRVLPYRTTDNRIDGVVVTFVDITARVRAERDLRASEEQFRRAIEEAPIPVLMQAEDGRVLQLSRTWTDLTGYALADVPTFDAWLTRAYGAGADAVRAHMHELFRGDRKSLDVEFAIRTRGGAERHWSFSASAPGALRDGQKFVVGMAVDVTERRQAEAALRASEGHQAFLLTLSDALRPLADPDAIRAEATRLLRAYCDVGWCAAVAYDAADAVGTVLAAATRPGLPAPAARHDLADAPEFLASLREGRLVDVPDLATIPALGPRLLDDPGPPDVRSLLGVPLVREGRPITLLLVADPAPRPWPEAARTLLAEVAARTWAAAERAGAEAALRASEERLRLALAAARMGIWTLDPAGVTQTRDANLNRLLGLEPTDWAGPFAAFLDQIHPDDRQAVRAAFDASRREGRPLSLEFRVVRPDGAVRWLRDQGDVFGEAGGPSRRMTGACVDITDLKLAEAAVREREERLRLIVTSVTDYAILTLDTDRRVTSWSPGAEAVFGYPQAEILGRSGDLLFTPEDRAADAPEDEARTAVREGRAADERWHLRQDGTRFYASGVLSPLGEGGSLGFVKMMRDLTERKRMEDALREARDRLEETVARRTADLERANAALREAMAARTELLRRVTTTEEDERRRISRELHDRLGQELTALLLSLRALERTIPEDAPGRDRLAEIERIVNQIGHEAHDLAVELRPTALDDIGLGPVLEAYVTRWSERTGIAAELQPLGLGGDRLPAEVESAVYRVVQEALNNVARHAAAGRVSLLVSRHEGELVVVIEDDGRGFDADAARTGAGRRSLGLLGMRERVSLVGGTLAVESAEGQGTVIQARIPLPGRPADAAPDR
jgi:PAS domain S-box-containing protein